MLYPSKQLTKQDLRNVRDMIRCSIIRIVTTEIIILTNFCFISNAFTTKRDAIFVDFFFIEVTLCSNFKLIFSFL